MNSSDSISQALNQCVSPLKTTDPTADFDDLNMLAEAFEDATIMGLGEATHGTREFFRMKDRLIRYLVTEAGLRLFALEANFTETLAINNYVTTGAGDPLDALAGIYFWTWDTEEVLALIEWLRDFNEDRPAGDQVRFYGIDMQYTAGPARAIRDYLADEDPELRARYVETLDRLAEMGPAADADLEAEPLEDAREFVDILRTRLDEGEAMSSDDSADARDVLIDQHCRTLEQALRSLCALRDDNLETKIQFRDQSMAENITWILDHEPHDRIVVWGHNSHVRRGSREGFWGEARSMGEFLKEEYGDEYVAIGFNFARGSFQSMVEREDGKSELRACRFGNPREGSITEILASVGEPRYFLGISTCADRQRLKPLLSEQREIRTAGARYYGRNADKHYDSIVLEDAYDGLIFLEETSRAIPLDRSEVDGGC